MNESIKEIAERLRGLREILEFSVEEMAEAAGVSPEPCRYGGRKPALILSIITYFCRRHKP